MKQKLIHKIFISVLVLFAMAARLQAQTIANDTANSWLKISPSTRNVGMGESLAAVPDAFDEVDVNPALIGLIGGSNISFSQDFWAQGLSMQHLVYSRKLGNDDGFSFCVDYITFGSIALYTVSGSVVKTNGSYDPIGLNIYGGYGLHLAEGLRVGLTAHFIYDNIQQSLHDQTASFDGGLFYQMPETPLSLSVVLTGFGLNLDDSALPIELKTAWAYQIDFDRHSKGSHFAQMNCLTLSAEGDWTLIDPTNSSFGFGGEYWYKGLIALRAGYRFADFSELVGLTGFSLGVGVRYLDWQVDYALTSLGDFGASNLISISLMMGAPEKKPTPAAAVTSAPTMTPPTPIMTPVPTEAAAVQPAENENTDMWELYEKGKKAFLSKDYEKAIQYFEQAEDHPGNTAWQYAEVDALLGVIYEYHQKTSDHLEMARHFYQTSLKIDPENKTALKQMRRWRNRSTL